MLTAFLPISIPLQDLLKYIGAASQRPDLLAALGGVPGAISDAPKTADRAPLPIISDEDVHTFPMQTFNDTSSTPVTSVKPGLWICTVLTRFTRSTLREARYTRPRHAQHVLAYVRTKSSKGFWRCDIGDQTISRRMCDMFALPLSFDMEKFLACVTRKIPLAQVTAPALDGDDVALDGDEAAIQQTMVLDVDESTPTPDDEAPTISPHLTSFARQRLVVQATDPSLDGDDDAPTIQQTMVLDVEDVTPTPVAKKRRRDPATAAELGVSAATDVYDGKKFRSTNKSSSTPAKFTSVRASSAGLSWQGTVEAGMTCWFMFTSTTIVDATIVSQYPDETLLLASTDKAGNTRYVHTPMRLVFNTERRTAPSDGLRTETTVSESRSKRSQRKRK